MKRVYVVTGYILRERKRLDISLPLESRARAERFKKNIMEEQRILKRRNAEWARNLRIERRRLESQDAIELFEHFGVT